MIEQAIIIRNDTERSITFPPQAHELKRVALEQSALIGKVETPEENEIAFKAQSTLADIRKLVEKARVAAKEPVLEFGKRIDATVKKFVEEVTAEEWRVSQLIGDFQQLELAKQRAAEQAARLEAEQIERQKQAELRRIAEEQVAEQRRRDAELRRVTEEAAAAKCKLDAEAAAISKQAAEARNAKERAEAERQRKELEARAAKEREESQRLQIEIARKNALAAATSHEAFDAANAKFGDMQAAVVSAPAAAPVRAEGQTVKRDLEITVTDIWMLAKAHPTCVKITPLISEIKTLCQAGVKVAGVTAKEIVKSQATRQVDQKYIEV